MEVDEQWECWTTCAIKTEGTYRGGEGATPETTACPGAGKVKVMPKKKKKKTFSTLKSSCLSPETWVRWFFFKNFFRCASSCPAFFFLQRFMKETFTSARVLFNQVLLAEKIGMEDEVPSAMWYFLSLIAYVCMFAIRRCPAWWSSLMWPSTSTTQKHSQSRKIQGKQKRKETCARSLTLLCSTYYSGLTSIYS